MSDRAQARQGLKDWVTQQKRVDLEELKGLLAIWTAPLGQNDDAGWPTPTYTERNAAWKKLRDALPALFSEMDGRTAACEYADTELCRQQDHIRELGAGRDTLRKRLGRVRQQVNSVRRSCTMSSTAKHRLGMVVDIIDSETDLRALSTTTINTNVDAITGATQARSTALDAYAVRQMLEQVWECLNTEDHIEGVGNLCLSCEEALGNILGKRNQ